MALTWSLMLLLSCHICTQLGMYLRIESIFGYGKQLGCTEIMRWIWDITAFLNGCWNSHVVNKVNCSTIFWMAVGIATLTTKWITARFFAKLVAKRPCLSTVCHTSKHFAQSNKLWGDFTVSTPLKVIRHTAYRQKLWFVMWIRLYRTGWIWSVNIIICIFLLECPPCTRVVRKVQILLYFWLSFRIKRTYYVWKVATVRLTSVVLFVRISFISWCTFYVLGYFCCDILKQRLTCLSNNKT
jgi:hypothetical protein